MFVYGIPDIVALIMFPGTQKTVYNLMYVHVHYIFYYHCLSENLFINVNQQ